MRFVTAAAIVAFILPSQVLAAQPEAPAAAQAEAPPLTAEQKAEIARMRKVVSELKPQSGTVSLPTANVSIVLGDQYSFLDAADSKRVLTELWGNPPEQANGVLGMVFPKSEDAVTSRWGAVITYQGDGYVSDEEARTTDYDKLLRDMQSGEEQENEARVKAGFQPVHLVGWAQPPSYDATRHSLVWARDLQFGATTNAHALNYDVRVLGRRGVLSVNIVSEMGELKDIQTAARALEQIITFKPGERYTDFDSSIDKRAGYGIAGLVAGGVGLAVAKKAGFLAILLVVLKKGAVFIIAGLAALGGWIQRQWAGMKRRRTRRDPSDAPPPPADGAP